MAVSSLAEFIAVADSGGAINFYSLSAASPFTSPLATYTLTIPTTKIYKIEIISTTDNQTNLIEENTLIVLYHEGLRIYERSAAGLPFTLQQELLKGVLGDMALNDYYFSDVSMTTLEYRFGADNFLMESYEVMAVGLSVSGFLVFVKQLYPVIES